MKKGQERSDQDPNKINYGFLLSGRVFPDFFGDEWEKIKMWLNDLPLSSREKRRILEKIRHLRQKAATPKPPSPKDSS